MMDDYSDVCFDQGLECLNTNNNTLCIVLDGHSGSSSDMASRVLEFQGGRLLIHTPPNRALKPTGKIRLNDLYMLKTALDEYLA